MCLTETWLSEAIPDSSVTTEGGHYLEETEQRSQARSQDACLSMKSGDLATISLRYKTCTPDMEILTVSMSPYYVLCECTHVFVSVIYVPPSANAGGSRSH